MECGSGAVEDYRKRNAARDQGGIYRHGQAEATRQFADADGFLTVYGYFAGELRLTWMGIGDAESVALPFAGARRRVMMEGITDRNLVPERSYCAVRPGNHLGPAVSRDGTERSDDTRLTTGASVLVILLSSLGLWAIIWAIVSALA